MKKILLVLCLFSITFVSHAQIIKIQGGTAISKLQWSVGTNDVSVNKTFIGYAIFAGVDYCNTLFFNLSSNVGALRKGGKTNILIMDSLGFFTGKTVTPSFDYLSLNTTIDLKYPTKENLYPFISIGPRCDFLVHKTWIDPETIDKLQHVSVGLLVGGGVKYDVANLQFGAQAHYYVDFMPIAQWENTPDNSRSKISTRTFTVTASVGYKLH
ncbi:MAG: hypothetical protein LBU90_05715 [Bacteroidales bacterium]|jgi:opacity protein-like surface antigen|nr:hypothetical protein [Bacteroidales bacterium]